MFGGSVGHQSQIGSRSRLLPPLKLRSPTMVGDCRSISSHHSKCLVRVWNVSFLLAAVVGVPHIMVCGGRELESTSTSASTTDIDDDNDSSSSAPGDCAANLSSGRIVQSLFRFPASRFGPEFDELLQNWYSDWLHVQNADANSTSSSANRPRITPEPAGVDHAFYSVSTAAATLFRRQCYGPAPRTQLLNLYNNFEQRRKEIAFQYMKDSAEELRLMHTMTKRFYPAFQNANVVTPEDGDANYHGTSRMHEKKSKSTVNTVHAESTLPSDCDSPSKLSFQTNDQGGRDHQTQKWSWYPPGHFSDRGIPGNIAFRTKMYMSMRRELQQKLQRVVPGFDGFDYGRQSGMFWYPPGGVREWHNNRLDLVGNTKGKGGGKQEEEIFSTQVWRMYFVRTTRDPEFDRKLAKLKKSEAVDQSSNDHSAMHIIPGDDAGITLEVLRRAGARLLNRAEEMRQWSDEFAEGQTHPPPGENYGGVNDEDGTVLDRNAVWRIPDEDGYVTLFRLPDIWHCIVSEEVHRYSLGFAFSDKGESITKSSCFSYNRHF